ncbi:MAG: DUF4388 domain-containing protein [Acidobacteria bacterium]|nr:DUF4388 domain-containing protein [Acidobacteriota bacterium]
MSARTLDFFDQAPPEPTAGGFKHAAGDVELIQRPEGFSGAISLPLLPDLIQIYTVSLANGALTIRRGAERGTIWFDHGEMVHAICGEEIGEEAVYRLLQWHNGQFSLDANARSEIRSIEVSWQNVLMEGCRRLDEAAKDPGPATHALDALANELTGLRAVALFDAEGELIAQKSPLGFNLGDIGPALLEMFRLHAEAMRALGGRSVVLDCFWTLGDQVHLIRPLRQGRMLHVAVDATAAQLALVRRAVEKVAEELG